jgi:hypothetical protein
MMTDCCRPLLSLTREEWRRYEWLDVTTLGDGERMMLRGRERTEPPGSYPPHLDPDE